MGSLSDDRSAIEQLIAGPASRLYVVAAGAGATLQGRLWSVPGISGVLVGGAFPYDPGAVDELIGYTPEKYVAPDVACEFAQVAYRKALLSKREGKPIGIGITASVAGTRIHRGLHQAFVAVFSDRQQLCARILFEKGLGYEPRAKDEDMTVALAMEMIYGEAGVPRKNPFPVPYDAGETVEGTWRWVSAERVLGPRDLFLARPYFRANGTREAEPKSGKGLLLVPGAFNPVHFGHFGMAKAAEDKSGLRATFAITLKPPHKDALSISEAISRLEQFRGRDLIFGWDDALYLQKAERFPGASFVIGADVMDRILDPKWCPVDPMLKRFGELETTFYVADRTVNGETFTWAGVSRKYDLQKREARWVWKPIQGTWDVSSTEIRAREV